MEKIILVCDMHPDREAVERYEVKSITVVKGRGRPPKKERKFIDVCGPCNKIFKQYIEPTTHKCIECGREFNTEKGLGRHKTEMHTKAKGEERKRA